MWILKCNWECNSVYNIGIGCSYISTLFQCKLHSCIWVFTSVILTIYAMMVTELYYSGWEYKLLSSIYRIFYTWFIGTKLYVYMCM